MLRRLRLADAEAYREVRLQGLRLHSDCFGSSAEVEGERPLSFFEDRLDGGWVLGAFRGERVIGVGGLAVSDAPKQRHRGFIWGMYVRAEARGSGCGRRLLTGLLERAAEQVEVVTLTVTASNAPAIRLYVAAGFAVYGLEQRALKLGEHYFDELLMSRDVGTP